MLALLVGVYFQIKFETYLKGQKNEYQILLNRNRKNFVPIAFWYFVKNDKYIKFCPIAYSEKGIKSYGAIRIYDEYLFFIYYSKSEKECIERTWPNCSDCLVP